MKVKQVTVKIIEAPMPGTLRNARRRWTRKAIALVFIESDSGIVGVGEAWTSYGTPRAVKATIDDDIAPLVLDKDPYHSRQLLETCYRSVEMSSRSGLTAAGVSAVEMALWDLIAKQLKLPLYRLLGAAADRVYAYASGGLYGDHKTAADLGQEMAGYVAEGFGAVKLKVGGAPPAQDIRRIAAAREAIGPDVRLMVDAHYTLNYASALKLARLMEPYDVYWFEAPLAPRDFSGQRRLQSACPVPLCGNETLAWADSFRDLIINDCVHFVMFDVSACGGIIESRKIIELAHLWNLPVTLHSSSSAVLFAASLHVAATAPNCDSMEYHMMHRWLWDKLPADLFALDSDGFIRPPGESGIGIELTPDDI